MLSFAPPPHIEYVLFELERAGHSAFLVGGCVRDTVLGLVPADWDVATSASPGEIASVFPNTALTGERYGTVTVLLPKSPVEVTTFRRDGEYRDNRRPESVEFVSELSGDLSRRDFTMNAMAISRTGELIDPFGGKRDIAARLIRCVGDPDRRFSEDALRMLRALRFSATLGFQLEQSALRAVKRLAPSCSALSAERVRTEIEKTLLSERPEIAGDMLKYGLLAGRVNDSGKNNENFSLFCKIPHDRTLRWCAFIAVLLGAERIASAAGFTRAMRLDSKTAATCSSGVSIGRVPEDDAGIKRLLSRHAEDAVRCAAAAHEVLYGEQRLAAVEAVISSGECYCVKNLAVKGGDLIARGIPPGKELGKTLQALLLYVIDNPKNNNRETLLQLLSDNSQFSILNSQLY